MSNSPNVNLIKIPINRSISVYYSLSQIKEVFSKPKTITCHRLPRSTESPKTKLRIHWHCNSPENDLPQSTLGISWHPCKFRGNLEQHIHSPLTQHLPEHYCRQGGHLSRPVFFNDQENDKNFNGTQEQVGVDLTHLTRINSTPVDSCTDCVGLQQRPIRRQAAIAVVKQDVRHLQIVRWHSVVGQVAPTGNNTRCISGCGHARQRNGPKGGMCRWYFISELKENSFRLRNQ